MPLVLTGETPVLLWPSRPRLGTNMHIRGRMCHERKTRARIGELRMCGIVGYVGKKKACGVLIEGLKRLEYRGYDSAGICVQYEGKLHIRKSPGRISPDGQP